MSKMSSADLTEKIFQTADLLRGWMDPSAYSDVISAMLLLKWASDQPGKLEVPESASWNEIIERAKNEPGQALNDALVALVNSNGGKLDGLFWELDFTRMLNRSAASQLVSHFNAISLKVEDLKFDDLAGQSYDQILAKFADIAGKKGGEFYTPRSVIQLMVRLADPQSGQSVYDPCCGSGGMLIGSKSYIAERAGWRGDLTLFAQEMNRETCRTARLNLLLHGASNASVLCGDTLANPLHVTDDGRLMRFDRILANPPLSANYQRKEMRFPERMRYGWTAENGRKADLMFVQHVLATLAPDGIGVVVTPHGVLFRGGDEADIRRQIIQEQRLAAVIGIGPNVFHGTSIPACVLVLRGSDEPPLSERGVFFVNAESEIATGRSRNHLDPRNVEKIVAAFRMRREISHFSRMVTIEEIARNGFNLNIPRYVESVPLDRVRLDYRALLFGGVPRADVDAIRDRFQAFGVDVADLFVSEGVDRLLFPPQGYDRVVEEILELTATSERKFLGRLRDWLANNKPMLDALGVRAPSDTRDELMKSFCKELLPSAVLDEYQLIGVFADWWEGNRDNLRALGGFFSYLRDGGMEVVSDEERESLYEKIEIDLTMRVKKVVAVERQKLVEAYRSWWDRYGTSLLDLENRLVASQQRLKLRLRDLGYPWPGNQ